MTGDEKTITQKAMTAKTSFQLLDGMIGEKVDSFTFNFVHLLLLFLYFYVLILLYFYTFIFYTLFVFSLRHRVSTSQCVSPFETHCDVGRRAGDAGGR